MPDVDSEVMEFVEGVLEKDPKIRLDALFQRAKEFKSSVGRLTKRQFNARYPLQVKRRRALAAKGEGGRPAGRSRPAKKTKRPSSRSSSAKSADRSPRETVRAVLLQFATDVAAAEERKDLVKVLADVDRYVDQVLAGAGSS